MTFATLVSASARRRSEAAGPPSTKIANLKGAWGTVLRVDGYTGPAIKVRDQAGVGPDVDIDFDAQGFVTDAAPYADTRVIRIYDQLVGGHDLIPYAGGTGNLPAYLVDATRWKTAAIDFRATSSDLFVDAFGPSGSHPYNVQDPYLCTTFQGINSSGFRAVCGVHRSTTSSTAWYSYGFWQDHQNGGLHWSIDGQSGQDANASSDTAATEDKYSVVMRVSSGTANLYLNEVNVGSDTYTTPISYLSTGAFMVNGIGENVNRNCGPWIEAFVLSEVDVPASPVATLTGYLHEARA